MKLGEKIYNLRKSRGVSQERLSEFMGVSRQTVSKWESNAVQPSTANLAALCEVFSVDKDYFYIEAALTKDEVDVTDIKEVVNEIVSARDRKKSIIRYAICIPILAVVLSVMTIITVWFGYASAPVAGADVSADIYEIPYEAFILMLIATLIVFLIEAVLIILLIFNIRNKRR